MFNKWLLTALFIFQSFSIVAMEEGNNKDLTNLPSIPQAQKIQKRPLSSSPNENQKEAKKPKLDVIETNSDVQQQNLSKEKIKEMDLAYHTLYANTQKIKIFASHSNKISAEFPAWIIDFLPNLKGMKVAGKSDCYKLIPGISIETLDYLTYVLDWLAHQVTQEAMISPSEIGVIRLINMFPKTTKNLSINDIKFALEKLGAQGILREFIVGCIDNAQGKPAFISILNKNISQPILNDNIKKFKEALKSSHFPQKTVIQTELSIPDNAVRLPGNGNWFVYAAYSSTNPSAIIVTLYNPITGFMYDATDKYKVSASSLEAAIHYIRDEQGKYQISIIDDKNIVLVDDFEKIIKITFNNDGTYSENEYKLDEFRPDTYVCPYPFIGKDDLKSPKLFNLRTLQFVPQISKEDFDLIMHKGQDYSLSPDGKYFVKLTTIRDKEYHIHITDLDNTDVENRTKIITIPAQKTTGIYNINWFRSHAYYLACAFTESIKQIKQTTENYTYILINPSTGTHAPINSNILFFNDIDFCSKKNAALWFVTRRCVSSINKKITENELQLFTTLSNYNIHNSRPFYRQTNPITILPSLRNSQYWLSTSPYVFTLDGNSFKKHFIFENLLSILSLLNKLTDKSSHEISMNQWYILHKILKKNPSDIVYLLKEEQDDLQNLFIRLASDYYLSTIMGIIAYNELKCCMNLYGYDEEVIGQRSDKEIESPEQFKQILARLVILNQKALKEMQENNLITPSHGF